MENMGSHSSEQETIRPNNGRMPPVESTTTCIPKHCKKPPTFGFFYQFFLGSSAICFVHWGHWVTWTEQGFSLALFRVEMGESDIITKLWLENIKKYILILRNSHFFARQAHVWKGNQASNFTLANNMFTTLLTINWGIQDIAYRSLWPAGLCSMLLWSDIRNGFFFTI